METNISIGIIGSGLIGRNWAMIFASIGHEVTIYDVIEEQIKSSLDDIKNKLLQYESDNVLRGKLTAQEQLNLIKGSNNLEETVKNSTFLQECIPELLTHKLNLYKKIDSLLNENTILSSSTSTFLPSVLSENLVHKNQFIVSHPINPPYFVPLVEIIPAPWTASWVIENTVNLMEKSGQVPVKFKKEILGFAVNRIQYAIINECFNLIEDNILDVKNIDKIMSEGLGMRYAFLGPLETAHLNADGFSNYCSRYSESMYGVSKTFKPPPKISGPTADIIAEQLNTISPLNELAERRTWRDESLIKLSQLKKNRLP